MTLLANPFGGSPEGRYTAPVPSAVSNSSPVKPGGADAVGQAAGTRPLTRGPLAQDAGGPNSGAQGAANSGDASADDTGNYITQFLNGDYRADPDLDILYINGEFRIVESLEAGGAGAILRIGKAVGRLPRFLRNKLTHIRNAVARGGNIGISGTVSATQALRLGEAFVGKGFRVMSNGKGLVSKDGLRQFRLPSAKKGINPMTGNAYSRTGVQVNFHPELSPRDIGRATYTWM